MARNLVKPIEKEQHINLIDGLDLIDKTTSLVSEHSAKRDVDQLISKLRLGEETKWSQCAKIKHFQKGVNYTKYFHLVMNVMKLKIILFQ